MGPVLRLAGNSRLTLLFCAPIIQRDYALSAFFDFFRAEVFGNSTGQFAERDGGGVFHLVWGGVGVCGLTRIKFFGFDDHKRRCNPPTQPPTGEGQC